MDKKNKELVEKLSKIAEKLNDLSYTPEDSNFCELGDWFHSTGSRSLDILSYELRQLVKEIK